MFGANEKLDNQLVDLIFSQVFLLGGRVLRLSQLSIPDCFGHVFDHVLSNRPN